ncbi:MAG TPA: phosphonoacetaldehyde hydrolase [Geminicoccaceae bacterium]|jgi:phosphonoacetaldehyde hydrolase|nr:phosphonoacetaldehyde hydrolase [Geminicoccaceae bacterium]
MPETQLQAVVLDWAGTVIDHGSLAPMGVFVRAFAQFGVEIRGDEARGPMGMAKRDHIKAVMDLPRVREAWRACHGAAPTELDVDRIYDVFVPMTVEVVSDHATLIDGVAAVVARLRARGLRIGSTTGYTREIMAPVLPIAAGQGYAPDNVVCAGDVAAGRPTPAMMYRTFLDLEVWPAWRVVKVDDTEVGIAEGLNAGCWTVGVAVTGNAFGLSAADAAALPPHEFEQRRAAACRQLTRAGAHHVVDGIWDLEHALATIEGALARGERP